MKTWNELPKEIKKKMLKRQFEQNGEKDKNVFKHSINIGFIWKTTKEGHYFWEEVLKGGNFELFYQHYPKKQMAELNQIGKLFEQFGKDLQNFKP
jgi:hypothetical protein